MLFTRRIRQLTTPVLQALVLADHVYIDLTGKKVIAGTFNKLWSATFPAVFGRSTYAYISLTDVRQKTQLRLRYVNAKNNEVLMETPAFDVEAPDPLASVEVVAAVPPFPMPHAGVFHFELYASDVLLGALRLVVEEGKP